MPLQAHTGSSPLQALQLPVLSNNLNHLFPVADLVRTPVQHQEAQAVDPRTTRLPLLRCPSNSARNLIPGPHVHEIITDEPSQLRVNQAGELAATLIYKAQTPLVVRQHPHLRPLMAHMYDQEAGHFATFNNLIHKHRVRPTALYPLWSVLATGLGWSTALMGREAAMACTEAVETEIGDHYNNQIREILEMITQWEAEGYEVSAEIGELVKTLRRIRDEELEHLDHAVEHDAKKAEPHWLLTGVIRAGCRGAIWVSERV
ncbi:ubiquinone biosynthesis monooxygenase Coq7, variant 2 [Metarhizium acridum]|uniref:5-demethoxyubiquinone hydroxylase, mitochondrial n=1 Tax=Metarhizium acridum (strain CQMa 102) TaxID=655827 RepID=E9DU54_METAQ|nr:ubiquinone biosynthesis protein Coq7, putative [Metarhizium acridum CQMa 102]EFY92914.1 ubiquinone biosynthesis protein Coq7, putative [Metarhizium acridum CQMa 102]KAG8419654.1 ubiquinone biosynthesis monooxygenase Coq7, variant 2 [Metarhizium acridum]